MSHRLGSYQFLSLPVVLFSLSMLLAGPAASKETQSFSSNTWHQVVVPRDTVNITFGDLFHGLPESEYGGVTPQAMWVVFELDQGNYRVPAYDEVVPNGESFWFVHNYGEDYVLDLQNPSLMARTEGEGLVDHQGVPGLQGCNTSRCFEVPLDVSEGIGQFSMRGTPHSRSITLGDLRIVVDDTPCEGGCTLAEAANNGFAAGTLFVYNGGYQSLTDPDLQIDPFQGYTLAIDPAAFNGNPRLQIPIHTASPSAPCGADTGPMRESFVQLINEVRSSGRYCGPEFFQATTPVVWNEQLFNAALGHSNDMATNNFFSHTGSDGLSLADRATNAGYPFRIVGENIAAGQYTTAEAVDSWVNSSGHCRNLMNPAFTEVALACVENPGSDYQRYWTNVLGDRFRGESRVGNVPITRAMP